MGGPGEEDGKHHFARRGTVVMLIGGRKAVNVVTLGRAASRCRSTACATPSATAGARPRRAHPHCRRSGPKSSRTKPVVAYEPEASATVLTRVPSLTLPA